MNKHAALVLLLGMLSSTSHGDGEPYSLDQTALRAELTPLRQATLSAEMTGKVAKLAVREGQRVEKGELLVAFDCDLQRAQLRKAEIEAEVARNLRQGNQRMAELNAIGQVELTNSELQVHKAEADIQYLQAMIKRCSIRAPFAGAIGDRLVRAQEFIQAGTPMLEILDDQSLHLEFIVPSSWLSWLVPGYQFEVAVDDLGALYPAKLAYTAAKIDPLSQSIKVVAEIDGHFPELRPGMSGHIQLQIPSTEDITNRNRRR